MLSSNSAHWNAGDRWGQRLGRQPGQRMVTDKRDCQQDGALPLIVARSVILSLLYYSSQF